MEDYFNMFSSSVPLLIAVLVVTKTSLLLEFSKYKLSNQRLSNDRIDIDSKICFDLWSSAVIAVYQQLIFFSQS